MDTQPKHEHAAEIERFFTASVTNGPNTPCPRQRFFAETRKRDDGDARAHRRGALTPYRRKRSERRLESFMNNAGYAFALPRRMMKRFVRLLLRVFKPFVF